MEQHAYPAQARPEDTSTPSRSPRADEAAGRAEIEDYLDQVCLPLADVVPYTARQDLRAELALHLHCLVEAYQEAGCTPEQAVAQALQRFGDARRLSRQWADEWIAGLPPGRCPLLWPAVRVALGCFAATLLPVALLVALPGPASSVGAHVPYCGSLMAALPLLGGLAAGWRAPGRQALGALCALGLLAAPLLAAAHLWAERGVAYGLELVLLAWWVPAGTAGAALAGWLRARGRRLRRVVRP